MKYRVYIFKVTWDDVAQVSRRDYFWRCKYVIKLLVKYKDHTILNDAKENSPHKDFKINCYIPRKKKIYVIRL